MAEHTKGPRYTWRKRAANEHCVIVDGQKDTETVIICETMNAEIAHLICTSMNALENYNPDAVRDVVEAAESAVHFSDAVAFGDDPLIKALREWLSSLETALARLGGAS